MRHGLRPARLLDRVRDTLRNLRLVEPGDLMLAGVSGGPDSVFLMHALHRILPGLGARLHILHLDHGLRGDESREDAAFVSHAAAALGLACTVERRPVPAAPVGHAGPQDRARRVRMAFFREMMGLLGARQVALGHTADDQVETLLLRLLAGGGPGALSGIRHRGPGGIIHPLLTVRKQELLAFLADHAIPFRTDRTNLEQRYLRNRVRHRIVPVMLDLNPSLHRRVAEVAALLGDDDDYLQAEARAAAGDLEVSPDGTVTLGLDLIAPLAPPLQRRMIIQAARLAGVPHRDLRQRQLDAVRKLLRTTDGGPVALPGGREAAVTPRGLIIGPPAVAPPRAFERELPLPGSVEIPELGIWITAAAAAPPMGELGRDPRVAFVDADRIDGTLRVRARCPGDWFIPLGLGHRQKLQDFFVNARLARGLRDTVPLLCDSQKIVWLGGIRLDTRAGITPGTTRAWRLEIHTLGGITC